MTVGEQCGDMKHELFMAKRERRKTKMEHAYSHMLGDEMYCDCDERVKGKMKGSQWFGMVNRPHDIAMHNQSQILRTALASIIGKRVTPIRSSRVKDEAWVSVSGTSAFV
jgi:hypothetical protein